MSTVELLMSKARESLAAAKLLEERGFHDFAASRAYYAMFYVAEALLLLKEVSFSSHTAVVSAFAQNFTRAGLLPNELHRYLVRAMEARHLGDYQADSKVTQEDAEQHINRAEEFIREGAEFLKAHPPIAE